MESPNGDNVSFTSCPAVIDLGQQGRCVAGVQRLLDADPPRAGIHHDGIFGQETLAATRAFQAGHGLPATGKADPGTIRMLTGLAPGPAPVPVAAALLTAAITGMIVLARTRPLISGPGRLHAAVTWRRS